MRITKPANAKNELALAHQTLANIFSGYPLIYIISLSRRSDRRDRVLRQLARLGITAEEFGYVFFDALEFDEAQGFPSTSVRGCFSSHREMMRRSSSYGQRALIMEDDIFFDIRALANRAGDIVEVQGAADLTYYGWLTADPDPDPAHKDFVSTIGGHFYGVSPSFASAMYDFMLGCETRPAGAPEGGPMYRDAAFNFYRKRVTADWRVEIIRPSLAGQFSSKSDLSADRWWDGFYFSRQLIGFARDIKTNSANFEVTPDFSTSSD